MPLRFVRRFFLYFPASPAGAALRPFHELKDSQELGQTLRKCGNVDAILYGHNHAGKKRNGTWDIARCYDAGTATRKDGSAGYHRVIDLTRDARLDYDGDFHGSD